MLSLSLSDIDLMMAQLNLGKTGYALVTSKENIVIAHPEKSEIGRKLNLQMPTTQQNLKLYSYQNPISGQNYWTFNFNLKSTGWKLVVMLNKDGLVLDIEEKPAHPKSNLIAPGVYVLDTSIFDHEPRMLNGEYYFTTMLDQFLKKHKVFSTKANFWITIGYPHDLEKAEHMLRKRLDTNN